MRRLLLLSAIPGLLAAEGHWVKFTSGPFEVLTDAGDRAGREALVRFEEFRHALSVVAGEQNLETPLPVRILVFKNAKGWSSATPMTEGRDRYAIPLAENTPSPPAVFGELGRLFLESSTSRMPASFEHGLIEFFSTLEVKDIHITAGQPPQRPNLDWARVHMLAVSPEYSSKLRVFLYNLRQGADLDPAYRNAFGKPAVDMEAEAKQYFEAGNFQTTSISSLPMSDADFPERPVSDADARLARADLLVGSQSRGEYEALLKDNLKAAEAHEGLGILALRDHNPDEARREFAAAMDAGSASPRCYIEYAKLEPDNDKAATALLRAAGMNPKLDEPFALLAARDTDPQKRVAHWKAAAERNPRNAQYWKSLAEAYLADHDFAGAAKAWTSGERAAVDPAERERMRTARLEVEQQRLDYEEAERKRKVDEEAREIDRLKAEARAEVRALEAKYSDAPSQPVGTVVPWWDGPSPAGKIRGALKQVDCLGKQARLVVEGEDHKTVKLLVTDPQKIAVTGANQQTLGCGVQKSRRVSIDYFPKADSKLATVGEVATIEFE
jgi:hypothetical protein